MNFLQEKDFILGQKKFTNMSTEAATVNSSSQPTQPSSIQHASIQPAKTQPSSMSNRHSRASLPPMTPSVTRERETAQTQDMEKGMAEMNRLLKEYYQDRQHQTVCFKIWTAGKRYCGDGHAAGFVLDYLLLNRLVHEGLMSTGHARNLRTRLCFSPYTNTQRLFEQAAQTYDSLFRNNSFKFSSRDWAHGDCRNIRRTNYALDVFFFQQFNCLVKRVCNASTCVDLFCSYCHPKIDVLSEDAQFEGVTKVILNVARLRYGFINQNDVTRIVENIITQTSTNSKRNRVQEIAMLLWFCEHDTLRHVAGHALTSAGTTGIDEHYDALDEDVITDQPETRMEILKRIDTVKLEKRLRSTAADVNTYKHFDVSSEKNMGLGEKTRAVLLEQWSTAVGAKISPPTLTLFHVLWLLKLLDKAKLTSLLHNANKSWGWNEEMVTQKLEIFTLNYLHNNHALAPLLPANPAQYEQELHLIQSRLTYTMLKLVQTKEAHAERGLRKCLQCLASAESPSLLSDLLTFLFVQTNLTAHHGVINIPVYLNIVARVICELRDRPQMYALTERDGRTEKVPVTEKTATLIKAELSKLASKIQKILLWDFEASIPCLILQDTQTENTPSHAPLQRQPSDGSLTAIMGTLDIKASNDQDPKSISQPKLPAQQRSPLQTTIITTVLNK